MEEKKYTKLSDLVGQTITIETVGEHSFKMWDVANSKMLTSDSWQEGYRKIYPVETDRGLLDISQSQMGQMLEAVSYQGNSTIVGRTFNIKSNGKTGKEIRYYFNQAKEQPKKETSDQFSQEDIPPEYR